jgi:hypothetical protein
MRRILSALTIACTLGVTVPLLSVETQAAGLALSPPHRAAAYRHRHYVYRWRCPERYTCYPLYGAYGPFGGVAYWDAYTAGGR